MKETVEDKETKETEELAKVVAASEEKEFMKPTESFGLTHKEEEKEKIQYFSPQKPPPNLLPEITLKKGTVRVAEHFQVDVIDSASFMNDSKKDTQSSVASRERNRVQFKKNMKPRRAAQPAQAEMFQLTDQQNWFEDSG